MKFPCLKNTEDVFVEIDRIIAKGVRLCCIRNRAKPVSLFVKNKIQAKTGTLLVVQHPQKRICPQKKCLFYYHIKGQAARYFHCKPVKQVGDFLALNYPNEIFEIQRRKHPRVKAYNGSCVCFTMANKQRVMVGKIVDVCMEGAKISGDFSTKISAGNLITPMSMTLSYQYVKSEDATIQVPEATVVRVVNDGNDTKEFSVRFLLPDKLQESMERYVDMCSFEKIR